MPPNPTPDADATILDKFSPQVATWFRDVFATPTLVQSAAWSAISAGENALVVAPTGSGKTLAAFLWALNTFVNSPGQTSLPVVNPTAKNSVDKTATGQEQPTNRNNTQKPRTKAGAKVGMKAGAKAGVKVLYISPLKALGVDVELNLRAPLLGINRTAQRLGLSETDISVGVRSGDTPAAERTALTRQPPDILITTPESAYLMLTSKASEILKDVDTVIIDEIHAIAGTKRGVHLALTLERLEHLVGHPVQRIGLSATVRPLKTVAQFLGGSHPVTIVNPAAAKNWDLNVIVPVPDMSDLPAPELGSTIGEITIDDPLGLSSPLIDEAGLDEPGFNGSGGAGAGGAANNSIWPHIEQHLYNVIMDHQSTLVFVNSRRTAEKLTAKLNELHALRHAPESVGKRGPRPPADVMKPVDEIATAPHLIARAHHGSVSKEERTQTETMLKEGALKAVVATSSLELGIDMGAVDLVVQVESPPSVASGLQRVGRAGHVVGATSKGLFYPKHRAELLQTAVTVDRMRRGMIEEIHVPSNALDVLLQHTIAAVAVTDWDIEHWFATVTRAYPYKNLDRTVFDAVIDLASGIYPSTDFAELRPRITYDRITGTLSARPGAQRIAVTSGGTIADRGMFGVFLLGGEQGARRVGELDEEMVYESRVGDVFTLGASSWRIEEITRDQVLVSPAPGLTGRLPFWLGDQVGRPAELGKALGAFRRAVAADPAIAQQIDRLDEYACDNLVRFVRDQQDVTGIVPDEKTLLVERFRDEVGDWRVVLHSPYGWGVNAAWALAVGAKISAETGIDAQPVSNDDGIVLRLPESDVVPGAGLFQLDPDDVMDVVAEQVGNSALFAARFRECAARGLLLPRKNPGKRAPLWQQRQRAAQLLDVARKYPSFPIILETVRECLQDVYDLPSLVQLCKDIKETRVRIAEVETTQPSPFASSILFTYTGAFVYEGDSPLAEKRAAALALDPQLLAKLLGSVELRDLLDPDIIAEVDANVRRVSESRRARTVEELVDALRILGPIPVAALPEHTLFDATGVSLPGRIMRVRIAGVEHLAQVPDAPLLRDGLGIPVPPGVSAPVAVVPDALEQLLSRWVRTHGPFVLDDVTAAFGLAAGVAHTVLSVLQDAGLVVVGHYRKGIDEVEYISVEVLRLMRSRSLAAARAQTRPVSHSAYARFLLDWHQIAPVGEKPQLRGEDGVFAVCEQLAGVRLPASAWESVILPSRVRDYNPVDLQTLCHNGEIHIVGAGLAGSSDPWVMLLPRDYAADLMPQPVAEPTLSLVASEILAELGDGGFFFDQVRAGRDFETTRAALWELFEVGLVSPDSFAPLAARLTRGNTAHRSKRTPTRSRLRMGRTVVNRIPPDMVGRWSRTVAATVDPTPRSVAHGEAWLDRYGVVTRGAVQSENVLGGFALAYKVLSGFEESGKALRGHFITDLGAAQFSTSAVIDRLRSFADSEDVAGWPSGTTDPNVCVLAACDPANPYGASLPWPGRSVSRSAGALVVLIDGLPMAHLSRGGKNLTLFDPPADVPQDTVIGLVVQALMSAVEQNVMTRVSVEKLNGEPVLTSEYREQFRAAGASMTPSGLRIAAPSGATPPAGGRTLSEAVAQLGRQRRARR
ncbi:MAG: DEAD/DEAH box helicase [Corynebacterium sp.]|nr:DEAD/DEAH box helicase [Corynebacterium sp.]